MPLLLCPAVDDPHPDQLGVNYLDPQGHELHHSKLPFSCLIAVGSVTLFALANWQFFVVDGSKPKGLQLPEVVVMDVPSLETSLTSMEYKQNSSMMNM